jgi:hypothetical protein
MPASTRRRDRYRGGRSRSKGLPPWAAILGIVVLLGVSGAAAWFAFRQVRADAIDEATLCPKAGATGELAILLDITDPLGATQSLTLRAALDRMVEASPRGTLVALGRVSDQPGELGAAYVLCRPMTGAEGGELTRNPRQLDQQFQDRFLQPFEAELSGMLDAGEAKRSPIMEGLQALLAGTAAKGVTVDGPRRIVIASDLLQNSDAMSFYRGNDWASFKASPDYARLAKNLAGAEVTIFRVPRQDAKVDPAAVDDFWVRYLDAQGADAVHVEPLGDL